MTSDLADIYREALESVISATTLENAKRLANEAIDSTKFQCWNISEMDREPVVAESSIRASIIYAQCRWRGKHMTVSVLSPSGAVEVFTVFRDAGDEYGPNYHAHAEWKPEK